MERQFHDHETPVEVGERPSAELLYLLVHDPAELTQTIAPMHSADIGELLGELPPEAAARVLTAIPFDRAVDVLDQPEIEGRAEVLAKMEPQMAAIILEALSADERAKIFRDLNSGDRERIGKHLDRGAAEEINLILRHSDETAAGMMTTEFITVPPSWTVADALRHIQQVGGAKETVYAIYVVDEGTGRLQGVVSLRELLMAERSARVADVGDHRAPITVLPDATRESTSEAISKYDLLAVPVVDKGGRVLGIVTVDDVIDALVEEHTEDVQRFGGMEALDEPYMETSIPSMFRKRGVWLTALFLGQTLTLAAMGYFEDAIDAAWVLAIFVPLIISSGGNSGSQATSLIIRAMALREVALRDWWIVVKRELPTGLLLGSFLGGLGAARIIVWQLAGFTDYGPHYLLLSLTVGLALVGVVTFGSLSGSMLPFALRRLGFDPASASAPFVATLVDVTGIVIYFSLAVLILSGTIL
jgi:magnesium transporter